MSNEIIGYYDDGNPIIQPNGYIYTQAFIRCIECQKTISVMGGPAIGSICLECKEMWHGKEPD